MEKRRSFYKMKKILVLLFCSLVLVLTACGGPEKKTEKPAEPQKKAEPAKTADGKQILNLFSWADNFDPEVLADFEKKYNCKINYDVFANNEELLAKIQAGGARYDVIQPSDYMVTTMLKLKLLEEMDLSKMPNTKHLIKDLQAPAYDPTGNHSVVYSWGITGIAYNKKFVKTPPTSWRDLWNPAYKGRVVLLNDVREVISFAMKMNGYPLNSVDKNHLAVCMKDLKALAPNILAYDTDTIKQKFIAEEAWIGTMWSGDAYFSNKENSNIGFVVPKEGTGIWADCFAIPKGAKNKELAQQFINYLYEPKVSAKNYEYIGYNDPNLEAAPYHTEEFKNDPILKTARDYIGKSEWTDDVGDAIELYDRCWTELKTGK